ncbi:MAG: hypothetical protein ABIM50_09835 [Novosphingobium sp.]
MTMTGDDMRQLTDELCAVLIAQGRTAGEADEIVMVATEAARESIQRLVEVVGRAPEGHRDVALVLGLNIMERLALSGYDLGRKVQA